MKKFTSILAIGLCVVFTVNTQAQRAENVGDNVSVDAPPFNGTFTNNQLRPDPLLFENGPLFQNAGPPNRSILQNVTIGNTTLGSAIYMPPDGNNTDTFSIADDFTLTEANSITQIDVYAYQTSAPTDPISITGVVMQIWDGDPSAAGSVIYGDLLTNVATVIEWSNTYREAEDNSGDLRAIMRISATFSDLTLDAGTYWLDYTVLGDGDGGFSGPWAPPIADEIGTAPSGNAFQSNGGVYAPSLDGGNSDPLDYPFELYGVPTAGVDDFSADQISFYPNPVSNVLNIQNRSTTQLETIEIYNVQGKLVQSTDISDISEVNVGSLTAGIYMVQITSERGVISKKLVKN